jgi:hypothetical protein
MENRGGGEKELEGGKKKIHDKSPTQKLVPMLAQSLAHNIIYFLIKMS